MAIRSGSRDQEVVAFLRSGHPRLAFATIVLKEGSRVAMAALFVGGGLSLGSDGRVATMFKSFLLLH